jgi:hypothetical protein
MTQTTMKAMQTIDEEKSICSISRWHPTQANQRLKAIDDH